MSHLTPTSPAITPAARWSDAQLLQAVAESGSQHCFEILVSRYAPLVLGVCRRSLHDEHEAEDAAQAVFLILWKKARKISRRGSAAGWLHRVARYVCQNVCRARVVRQKHEREAVTMKSPSEECPGSPIALRETLDEELDRLPEKYRVPLILFHFQGKTLSEIAELTNTNPSTLGTRMGRGRELLARRLSRRGVAVTGAMLTSSLSAEAALAGVPGVFAPATTEAAILFSAGGTGGPLSATASATATEVMKSMLLVQVKFSAVIGLVCAVLLGGGIAFQSTRNRQPIPLGAPLADVAVRQGSDYAGMTETIAAVVPPSVALSDDARMLVVGEEMPNGAGHLRCWDTTSGALIHERFEPFGIVSVAVSPDGRRLAYARGDHTMQIVSTAGFVDQAWLRGHVQRIHTLAFSPDGRQLASSGGDWTIRMWDVDSGRRLAMVKTASKLVTALAFADDGNRIVSHGQSLEWWNWTGTSLERGQQVDFARPVDRLAFAADGAQMVATFRDHVGAAVVDPLSGEAVTMLAPGHVLSGSISTLAVAETAQISGAGTTGGEVFLWDMHDGRVIAILPGDDGPITALATDANGTLLTAVSAQGQISVWNLQTQQPVRTLEQPILSESPTSPIAFAVSPGGQFAAVRRRASEIEVYETLTGRRVAKRSVPDDDSAVFSVSDNGKWLVTGSADGRLLVHDLSNSDEPLSIPTGGSRITAAAVADSGPIAVAADEAGFVCQIDLNEARILQRQKLHEGPVQCLTIAPPGELVVTAGADGIVRVHKIGSLQRSQRIGRNPTAVTALAGSASGNILATSDTNGTIRIWKRPSANAQWTTEKIAVQQWLGQPVVDSLRVTSLAIGPQDSTLVIGTEALSQVPTLVKVARVDDSGATGLVDETIERRGSFLIYYDLRRQRRSVTETMHSSIGALAFPGNDRSLLVGTKDGSLYRRRGSLEPAQAHDGHEGGTRFVAYLPDGKRLVSGGEDETIRLWSAASGKLLKSVDSEHGVVVCGALAPDGRTLVTGGYGSGVYFWDPHTLQRSGAKFHHHHDRIGGLTFSRDSKWLATASWDKSVKIWDARTHRVVSTLDGFKASVCDVQFSDDGTLLAACAGDWTEWFSDGEVRVWDRATGAVRFQNSQVLGAAKAVDISPDGTRLMACTSAMSIAWDINKQTAADVRRTRSGTKLFTLLSDKRTLIECVEPNILQISDVASGLVRAKFHVDAARINHLAVAPDERHFAVATTSNEILVWELETQQGK